MTRCLIGAALLCACAFSFHSLASAQEVAPAQSGGSQAQKNFTITEDEWTAVKKDTNEALVRADSAWMLISTALVLLMVPGLALFYGGMVRRKNVLATMMQSMVALAVVGVFWVAFGYGLAFGDPWIKIGDASFLGWNSELFFLKDVTAGHLLPNSKIPVFLHMLFQGMFAIITPALISGAIAERIRFKPYCLFLIAWVTLVYCPLAHCVWAMDWNWATVLAAAPDVANEFGQKPIGWLGKMGALDFAGGTVVHIAAGFSSLAAFLVLRKRLGYPQHSFHPNSMVLTLTGAGILWFGWFGFNGGSGLTSGTLATSAFAATQVAAAAAALSWMLVEWLHRGKPTALGLASGLVAGLVAVTPASGFILPWGGFCIGLVSGIVCYISVNLKSLLKYDDSLDAFGVHGVGGFLGAVLTGVFCIKAVNSSGADGLLSPTNPDAGQLLKQLYAAAASAVIAFAISFLLVKLIDLVMGFVTTEQNEIEGLDRTEHGETGFDFGLAQEAAVATSTTEPRPALIPPNQRGRFQAVVEGVSSSDLSAAWNELCQPNGAVSPEFKTVYPYVTTVQGNRFQFRGGDKELLRDNLQRLFQNRFKAPVKVKVDA